MWDILMTHIYKEIQYMNVRLTLLILGAYFKNWVLLYTGEISAKNSPDTSFSGFCSEFCQYDCVPAYRKGFSNQRAVQ